MSNQEPVIVKCEIGPYPRPMPEGMFDPMPSVKVKFSDGREKTLFEFYPDEISFDESEFIGLTESTAQNLRVVKDMGYIKS
jgi:hypothetical protein